MLTFTEAEVLAWVTPILWPFLRVLALFSALPVLAQRSVPMRLRIGLAFLVAVCAQASIPAIEPIALDSSTALLAVLQQVLIGLSLGFAVRIVFAAVAVLVVAGPWMLTTLVEFLQRTLQSIPSVVG